MVIFNMEGKKDLLRILPIIYSAKKNLFSVLSILSFVTSIAFSQWSYGPDSSLIVDEYGIYPSGCSDGQGGFYSININVENPNDRKLNVHRFNKFGFPVWEEPVSIYSQYNLHEGRVILANDTGVIVGYAESEIVGYENNGLPILQLKIVHQKIDSTGNIMWDPNGVKAGNEDTFSLGYEMVSDNLGGVYSFIILTEDMDSPTSSVMLQHISGSGERLLGESGWVLPGNSSYQKMIKTTDGAIILYFITHGMGFPVGTFMKIVNDSTVVWETTLDTAYVHSIIPDNEGGVIISGKKNSSGYFPHSSLYNRFYSNRIDNDGNFPWGMSGIMLKDSVHRNNGSPHCIFQNNAISYFWQDSVNSIENIVTKAIDMDGVFLFDSDFIVVNEFPSNKTKFQLISDIGYNIITWLDDRTGDFNLYSQAVDVEGNIFWNPDGIHISSIVPELSFVTTISDNMGGLISIFEDDYYWVPTYAQHINALGEIGHVLNEGDINLDGIVNVVDIVQYVSAILDETVFPIYEMRFIDLNSDSLINIVDIVLLVDEILGD
ncbi:MAG: hypothetical protein HOK29_12570 [Candidatus Marinimicrobia bacterium]|nr:hypothetical protein [Candidatus Neomarinimicrobiota bacterium]